MSAILMNIPYLSAISVSGYQAISYACMIAVPAIMVVLFVVALLRNRKLRLEAAAREKSFTTTLDAVDFDQGNVFDNLQTVRENLNDEEISEFLDDLSVQSERLYRGKWLPDPEPLLLQKDVFHVFKNARFNALISALLIVLGIIAAVVVLVADANLFLTAEQAVVPPLIMASLIPLGTGLVTAILLSVDARNTRYVLAQTVQNFSSTLANTAPVYQDRAGVTLLISELISYGETMRQEVRSFSEIAQQLVEGEFAEGVRNAVRRSQGCKNWRTLSLRRPSRLCRYIWHPCRKNYLKSTASQIRLLQ